MYFYRYADVNRFKTAVRLKQIERNLIRVCKCHSASADAASGWPRGCDNSARRDEAEFRIIVLCVREISHNLDEKRKE